MILLHTGGERHAGTAHQGGSHQGPCHQRNVAAAQVGLRSAIDLQQMDGKRIASFEPADTECWQMSDPGWLWAGLVRFYTRGTLSSSSTVLPP